MCRQWRFYNGDRVTPKQEIAYCPGIFESHNNELITGLRCSYVVNGGLVAVLFQFVLVWSCPHNSIVIFYRFISTVTFFDIFFFSKWGHHIWHPKWKKYSQHTFDVLPNCPGICELIWGSVCACSGPKQMIGRQRVWLAHNADVWAADASWRKLSGFVEGGKDVCALPNPHPPVKKRCFGWQQNKGNDGSVINQKHWHKQRKTKGINLPTLTPLGPPQRPHPDVSRLPLLLPKKR